MADIDEATKAALVRKGNELYNQGKIQAAYRCYVTAHYQAGIEKIGDFYFYTERQPLVALPYYFKVKSDRANRKVDEIFERMVFAFKKILRDDTPAEKGTTDEH
ncbi:MAG: hypothetical protein AABZ39_08715 [Spirochaetota bacterium]